MKQIINFLGIAFWGSGLIYCILILFLTNEFSNFFCMKNANDAKVDIIEDSVHINIMYTYHVDHKEHHEVYKMYLDYFKKCEIDSIVIKYNTIFPSISCIDGIPLKGRRMKVGIVISSFFLLFLILLWNLSDKEKWIKRYGG